MGRQQEAEKSENLRVIISYYYNDGAAAAGEVTVLPESRRTHAAS